MKDTYFAPKTPSYGNGFTHVSGLVGSEVSARWFADRTRIQSEAGRVLAPKGAGPRPFTPTPALPEQTPAARPHPKPNPERTIQ